MFEKTYDDEKKSGIYTATALYLESDAGSKNIAFSELNMNMQYAVNQEYTLNGEKVVDYSEVSALSEDKPVDADIVTFDAEGNTISQESIGDALATAGAEKTGEGSISAKADMVIYLDPDMTVLMPVLRETACQKKLLILKLLSIVKQN